MITVLMMRLNAVTAYPISLGDREERKISASLSIITVGKGLRQTLVEYLRSWSNEFIAKDWPRFTAREMDESTRWAVTYFVTNYPHCTMIAFGRTWRPVGGRS